MNCLDFAGNEEVKPGQVYTRNVPQKWRKLIQQFLFFETLNFLITWESKVRYKTHKTKETLTVNAVDSLL